MTIPTEVIMRMATLGLNEAQAKAVAEMLSTVEQATAADGEAGKEKARERWRRWKANQDETNVSKRLPTTGNVSKHSHESVAPVSDKPINTDTPISESTAGRDLAEFKAGLATLDADQVSGLVKVRRAKKAPITGYAATLFAKAAAKCGLSISEAADMCIERNWLTVKPEWITPAARGSPSRQPATGSHNFTRLAEDMIDEPERTSGSDQSNRHDAGGVPLVAIADYRRHG